MTSIVIISWTQYINVQPGKNSAQKYSNNPLCKGEISGDISSIKSRQSIDYGLVGCQLAILELAGPSNQMYLG